MVLLTDITDEEAPCEEERVSVRLSKSGSLLGAVQRSRPLATRPSTPPRAEQPAQAAAAAAAVGASVCGGALGETFPVTSATPGAPLADALAAYVAEEHARVASLLCRAPASDVAAQLLLRRARLAGELKGQCLDAVAAAAEDTLPALRALLAQLDGEQPCAMSAAAPLLALHRLLQSAPDAPLLFRAERGDARLLRHLAPPTLAPCAAALRCAVHLLSPQSVRKLAASSCARSAPPAAAAAALQLLAAGSQSLPVRLLALAPPQGAQQPLAWLAGLAGCGGCGSAAGGIHLAHLLGSFSQDAASRAALRGAGVAPLKALLGLEACPLARGAPAATAATAAAAAAAPTAATSQSLALRRAALDAFARLADDAHLARSEAFQSDARPGGRGASVKATPLCRDALKALNHALSRCKRRPAPVLGWDGKPKGFEPRWLDADADEDDANLSQQQLSTPPPCCALLALRCLCALLRASPRNAASVLFQAGCGEVLSHVCGGFAAPQLQRAARDCAGLMLAGCVAALDGACDAGDVASLSGLLCALDAVGAFDARLRAAHKLAQLIPTASGDDFAAHVLAPHAALQTMHIHLCQVQAAAAAHPRAALTAPYSAAFAAALERCRAGGATPRGGYWDVIGSMEISRMDTVLAGAPPSRETAVQPCAPVVVRAPSRAAAAKPEACVSPKGDLVEVERAAVGARLSAAAARVKPLPWDPPAAPAHACGASAPAKAPRYSPVPTTTAQPLIKKGFFSSAPPAARRAGATAAAAAAAAAAAVAAAAASSAVQEPAQEPSAALCDPPSCPPEAPLSMCDDAPAGGGDGAATAQQYDEDGLRCAFDSGGLGASGAALRSARACWASTDLRQRLSWTQDSASVTALLAVPAGTRAKDVRLVLTPTRLTLSLAWHGRVLDGPLARRCKASEAVWSLDDTQLSVMLPKDDPYFWKSLFEGGEEKSHYAILQELVQADEAAPSCDQVDDQTRDLLSDLQEHQGMINEGLIDPVNGFDDFRLVLGDGDGAK